MLNKEIIINTNEEYDKFKKKLWLYRSWLYCFVSFKISGKVRQKELKDFETALNIKNDRKRTRFIYDRACKFIDEYNEKHCICCEYHDSICEDPKHQKMKNGCCWYCHLQTNTGCPSRNLACKLFFCDHMWEKHHPLTAKDIDILLMFSPSRRAIARENTFVTEETFLRQLDIGSYGLMCIYSITKLFRFKNL